MTPLLEQSHYEVLEVAGEASVAEIERAYRVARATYAEESMALYSVFDDRDAAAIRERLDQAYRVLADPDARRRYDEEQGSPAAPAPERGIDAPPLLPDGVLPPLEGIEQTDAEEEDVDGPFDGSRLRRARLRRGIEIEQVASVTKINSSYLRFIESDAYDDLPAAVYIRGFVGAYARAIGLDAARVSAGYMAHMEAESEAKRPARLLGRH